MGKYIVTNGQNIYDISLALYGSIEGIVDLLMNNMELSLVDDLQTGVELVYTDDFVINADVVSYNRQHRIVPANGERSVYPKYFTLPLVSAFRLSNTMTSVSFSASGTGKIEIDWGDNSSVEIVELERHLHTYHHIFDNETGSCRQIRWFSEASFVKLDWSGLKASAIYVYRPLKVEEIAVRDVSLATDFLYLLNDTYESDLHGLKTDDLTPLVSCRQLMRLDLRDAVIRLPTVDDFLIKLATLYGQRRSCEVQLSVHPGGVYQEPLRDENGRYLIVSGMEAIWVILHEPAWNEANAWKFIINDEIYTV